MPSLRRVPDRDDARLRDALLEIEPDLRTISGLLVAYRIMGEAADHIEPEAVGEIARYAIEALDRATNLWRAAVDQHAPESPKKVR